MLTHADVHRSIPKRSGNDPCRKRCTNCPRMINTYSIKSNMTDFEFKIRGNLNCTSHYVIYLLRCRKCHIQYIGQTTNSIAMRMTAHTTDIRKKKNTSISNHFNSQDHTLQDMEVCSLTRTSKDLHIRLRHEEAIICQMGTAASSGLNLIT